MGKAMVNWFRWVRGAPPTGDAPCAGKRGECSSREAHDAVSVDSAGAGALVPPRCREIVEWAIAYSRDAAPFGEGTEAGALMAELLRMARANPQVVSYLVSVLENRAAGATATFGGRPERFLMEVLAETGHKAVLLALAKQLLRPAEKSSDAHRRWRAAAIALGRLRDPRAIRVLKRAYALGRARDECEQSIAQLGGVSPLAAPAPPAAGEKLEKAGSEAAEAGAAEAEATEPEAAEAGAAEAEATEPEAAEAGAAEAEATEAEATEPEAAKPGAAEVEVAEPEAAKPGAAEVEVAEAEVACPPMEQQEPTIAAPPPLAETDVEEVGPACPEPPEAVTKEDAPARATATLEVPPAPPVRAAAMPAAAAEEPSPPAASGRSEPDQAGREAAVLPDAMTDRPPASVRTPTTPPALEAAVHRYVEIIERLMANKGPDWRDPGRVSADDVRQAVKRAEAAPQNWAQMPVLWPDLVRAAVAGLPPVREDEARRVLLVVSRKARSARGGLDATLTALFRCMAEDGEKFLASGSPVNDAGSMLIRNIKVSELSPSVVHVALYPPGSRAIHLVVRIGGDEYLLFTH
jgi:hypothetical protein